jgi:hypothetical protein
VKDAELASHLLAANAEREVKTNGTPLILIRCPRCAREFAREPDQSAWRAVHVGVFRVQFLGPSEREHEHRFFRDSQECDDQCGGLTRALHRGGCEDLGRVGLVPSWSWAA